MSTPLAPGFMASRNTGTVIQAIKLADCMGVLWKVKGRPFFGNYRGLTLLVEVKAGFLNSSRAKKINHAVPPPLEGVQVPAQNRPKGPVKEGGG